MTFNSLHLSLIAGMVSQVEVMDPLALATAASGLKEEEDVTTVSQVTQCPTTASPTLQEVGSGGLVSGTQYITMSGQPTVTIPVVGGMQAHLPAISHVVQVYCTYPFTFVLLSQSLPVPCPKKIYTIVSHT